MTPVDATITATVKALAKAHDLSLEHLWALVDMKRSTFYRHMRQGGWTAEQVQQLADVFGVSVADLYDGMGGRLVPGKFARRLTRQYRTRRRAA